MDTVHCSILDLWKLPNVFLFIFSSSFLQDLENSQHAAGRTKLLQPQRSIGHPPAKVYLFAPLLISFIQFCRVCIKISKVYFEKVILHDCVK